MPPPPRLVQAGATIFHTESLSMAKAKTSTSKTKTKTTTKTKTATKSAASNGFIRVGDLCQNAMLGNGTLADAEKHFHAKFRDKTKNAWEDRAKFVAKAGKYTLIEIEHSAEATQKAAAVEQKLKGIDKEAAKLQPKPQSIAASKLRPSLQKFVSLIFDHDVFRGAMASYDIDVKKMPLGQLTKHQVQLGYEVLEELETAIGKHKAKSIDDLSSKFYTLIPHAFGRHVPPPIST